jgi:asparagine synthase (glutamine-hydrolysing)
LSEDKQLILAANGEIYNHRELRKQFEGKYNFQTESDCEVILAIRKKDLIYRRNERYFWFYIYDVEKDEYFVAVITWVLFHYTLVGINMEHVASESIGRLLHKNSIVSSGHYMTSKDGNLYNGTRESGQNLMQLKTMNKY